MKERLKIFNKNNNTSGLPIKSESNTKKEPPKKLIINPNLYGKDGKIRIITSKDKVNINKQKKENLNINIKDNNNTNNNTSNNDKKTNEISLEAFLYGDSTGGDENDISRKNTKNEKVSKPIIKKKIQEKPKKVKNHKKKQTIIIFWQITLLKKTEKLSSNLQVYFNHCKIQNHNLNNKI